MQPHTRHFCKQVCGLKYISTQRLKAGAAISDLAVPYQSFSPKLGKLSKGELKSLMFYQLL